MCRKGVIELTSVQLSPLTDWIVGRHEEHFNSLLQEAFVSSPGVGRAVHSDIVNRAFPLPTTASPNLQHALRGFVEWPRGSTQNILVITLDQYLPPFVDCEYGDGGLRGGGRGLEGEVERISVCHASVEVYPYFLWGNSVIVAGCHWWNRTTLFELSFSLLTFCTAPYFDR